MKLIKDFTISVLIALIVVISLAGFCVTTIRQQHTDTPVVERIDNMSFVNAASNDATDFYRVYLDDGIIDVSHNAEHYTTVYQTKNNDTLIFATPTGEIIMLNYFDYTQPADISIGNTLRYLLLPDEQLSALDSQVKITLSRDGASNIILVEK